MYLSEALTILFNRLRKDANKPESIPAYINCEFYLLKNLVSMVKDRLQKGDVFLDRLKQACLKKSNRVRVDPLTTTVSELANEIVYNYVYLVIIIPDRKYHQSSE